MDGHAVRRVHRALLIDGFTEHVHDPAEGLLTDGNGNRRAGVLHGEAAGQSLGSPHGNGPNHAIAKLLLHLKGKFSVGNPQGVIHLGHFVALELDVDDGANDLNDSSAAHDARFLSNNTVIQACLNRLRAANNFRNFLRNRRLSCVVVAELEIVDELSRVLRCVLHGDHLGRLFAGRILHHGLIHRASR